MMMAIIIRLTGAIIPLMVGDTTVRTQAGIIHPIMAMGIMAMGIMAMGIRAVAISMSMTSV